MTDATHTRARTRTMDAQTLDPPRRILFSWTITAYLRTRPPRAVVRVRRFDATMGAVLAACGRARVSSVLANDGDDDGDDDDWWMIGVRDVARAFINAYYDTATTREDDDDDDDAAHARAHADDFYDEFWRSSAWEYGRRASMMRERHATSRTLLDVVDALRDEPLVVVNVVDGGRVVDVITRFDIVEFLHRHVKILGDITTALVSRLFRAKNVLRAPARASALACVRDMVREDVSAIALTDDDGGKSVRIFPSMTCVELSLQRRWRVYARARRWNSCRARGRARRISPTRMSRRLPTNVVVRRRVSPRLLRTPTSSSSLLAQSVRRLVKFWRSCMSIKCIACTCCRNVSRGTETSAQTCSRPPTSFARSRFRFASRRRRRG